jgi:predicted AlkP superfamily phosphohydrolase/phosphomutase
MVTFAITDWAHHNLWKYIDPTHPFFEEDEAKKFGSLMLEIYRKIDSIVGEFLKIIGPQINGFILSDHGTG